jgi:hypothetical protein
MRTGSALRALGCSGLAAVALSACIVPGVAADSIFLAPDSISLVPLGGFRHGGFAEGAAEISAYDPGTRRLFVVNAQAARVDVLDLSDAAHLVQVGTLEVTAHGAVANSVAIHDGLVAVAVEAPVKTDPGRVVFFSAQGQLLGSVHVGALPDMVTFTPDGHWVLVGNEGEPDDSYAVDPEGSVSVIDVSQGGAAVTQADVRTAGFSAFNGQPLPYGVRVFGPGASAAQDFEPEYIAVSYDSSRAWVTLQENNAVAVLDVAAARIVDLHGLGFKDHLSAGAGLDASDRDGAINIASWPVQGMYLPDSIAAFRRLDATFLVMANEGDSRDYSGFSELARVGGLSLDPVEFPNAAELQRNAALGRLRVTTTAGDTDGDGDFDQLYSFGGRSLSIRDATGELIWDSGDMIERVTAAALPAFFNSDEDSNASFDTRSDDKGPEPEGLTLGRVGRRTYAFVSLERIGGIVVVDVTDPWLPSFVQYVNTRDFTGAPEAGTAGDLAPEGLIFISDDDSPTGEALLVAAYEISGTTRVFGVRHLQR